MKANHEYTTKELDKMRELLTLRDIDQSDDSTLYDVMMEGCTGWANFDDDFVIEMFSIHFTDEDLK